MQKRGNKMSTPGYSWWSYAVNVAADYHRYMEEDLTLSCEHREKAALQKAIQEIKTGPEGAKRLAVISAIYFGESRQTIKEAAAQANASESEARRFHKEFIQAIGCGLGFGLEKPRKRKVKKQPKTSGNEPETG